MSFTFDDSKVADEFAPFWQAARRSRLSFPHCRECGRFHWYPMPLCPHCQSAEIEWQEVPANGELYSYTTVYHPYQDDLAKHVPYVVGLVEFKDAPGIRLVTNVVDVAPEELRVGMPVSAVFSEPGSKDVSVRFRPQQDGEDRGG